MTVGSLELDRRTNANVQSGLRLSPNCYLPTMRTSAACGLRKIQTRPLACIFIVHMVTGFSNSRFLQLSQLSEFFR